MPRTAKLKPVQLRDKWAVNVPADLSETGKRRQLFFDTRSQAAVECEQLKTRKHNEAVGLTLPSSRIAAAMKAYELLDPLGIDLMIAVQGYIDAHKARTASISFAALFDQYLAMRQHRHPEYLREIRYARDRWPELHDKIVSDITHRELTPLFDDLTAGARRKVISYFRSVFRLGVKRGYLDEDPTLRMDHTERRRTEVEIVPIDQVERMLGHALERDLDLLPFLVLGFFCGIRPDGELQRVQWADVHLDDRKIVMRAEITKKNQRRFIDVQPNAIEWLMRCPNRTGMVVKLPESTLRSRRRRNRKAAGIDKLPHSGMRHTFASCHLNHFKDQNSLMLQIGHNDPEVLYRHYFKAIPEADAQRFWSIVPRSQGTSVIVAFAQQAR
jgi:integrase